MLNNKVRNNFIKDHHFYCFEGNQWNSLARASNKTLDFYHRKNMRENDKILERENNALTSKKGLEKRAKTQAIHGRKIEAHSLQMAHKAERLLLQEKSSQPIDIHYEQNMNQYLEKLSLEDVTAKIFRKSSIKQTLASGGVSKNSWNDFSRMSLKTASMNFPLKVVQKDEEGARMIHARIIEDEKRQKEEFLKKRQKIEEIRKQKREIMSTKREGPYTRPFSALITHEKSPNDPLSATTNTLKDEKTETKQKEMRKIQSAGPSTMKAVKPSQSKESFKIKTSQKQLDNPQQKRPLSVAVNPNSSSPEAQNPSKSGYIPLERYSEFNNLFVSKLNRLNTSTGTLPFSTILKKTSGMIRENLAKQQAEKAEKSSLSRPVTGATRLTSALHRPVTAKTAISAASAFSATSIPFSSGGVKRVVKKKVPEKWRPDQAFLDGDRGMNTAPVIRDELSQFDSDLNRKKGGLIGRTFYKPFKSGPYSSSTDPVPPAGSGPRGLVQDLDDYEALRNRPNPYKDARRQFLEQNMRKKQKEETKEEEILNKEAEEEEKLDQPIKEEKLAPVLTESINLDSAPVDECPQHPGSSKEALPEVIEEEKDADSL